MKKLFTLAIALMMMFAITVAVYADSHEVELNVPTPSNAASCTEDVVGKLNLVKSFDRKTVYRAVVTWDLPEYAVTGTATYRWDAAELKYVMNEGITYNDPVATSPFSVKIENYSDCDLEYRIETNVYTADHNIDKPFVTYTVTEGPQIDQPDSANSFYWLPQYGYVNYHTGKNPNLTLEAATPSADPFNTKGTATAITAAGEMTLTSDGLAAIKKLNDGQKVTLASMKVEIQSANGLNSKFH